MIDKSPFYLEGLASWPAEVRGNAVAVGGKPVDKPYLPEALRDAKGVIEAPTWRALKEPK